MRFLLILLLTIPVLVFGQTKRFNITGVLHAKDAPYDNDLPFAKPQHAAELYAELVVNDSIIVTWGPTNNWNHLKIASENIEVNEGDKIILNCYDEDGRKSAGFNRDDFICAFDLTEDLFKSKFYRREIDSSICELFIAPISDATMRISSFTPSKKYRGKVKRGMKKDGLSWRFINSENRCNSAVVKGGQLETITWTDSCELKQVYEGGELYFEIGIFGKHYIRFAQYGAQNPYIIQFGENEIITEYGTFTITITPKSSL